MPDNDLNVALRLRASWEGRQLDRGVRRLRRGLDSVSDGLRRMESRATSALLAFGGIEAVRRPIVAAVREFAAVETGLVGVAKTADLSGEALARLDKRITGLSLTPEVGQTRTELLEIAQTAGQLGVQGVDDITRFTATISKLVGASSDLGGAEAATALARILGVTEDGIDSVDRLGSVIARLGNTFRATEGEIVHAGTRVATTLSALYGVSSREAAALGTALRDLGLRAEIGATGLGRAFAGIVEAARAGGDAGARLEQVVGQSLDRILERIGSGDTLGVFTDFLAGLGDAGAGITQILADLGIEGIESTQVLGTLAGNLDRVRSILAAADDEWTRNTALTEEALRAAQTFSRQMQLVTNEIDASAAAIGGVLAPALLLAAQNWQVLAGAATAGATQIALLGARRIQGLNRTLDAEVRVSRERRRLNLRDATDRRARAAAAELTAKAELFRARNAQAAFAAEQQLGQRRIRTIGDQNRLTARQAALQAATGQATRAHAQAQRDLAVATSVATRAQRAHNIVIRRGNTLLRLGRGALAAMGGPIGLLTTALAAGVGWWLTWASTAKGAVEDVEQALKDRVRATIEGGRGPLEVIDTDVDALEARIAALDSQILAARQRYDEARSRAGTGRNAGLTTRDRARRDLQALTEQRAELEDLFFGLLARGQQIRGQLRDSDIGTSSGTGSGTGSTDAIDALVERTRAAQDRIAELTLSRLDRVHRAERQALADLDALRDGSAENDLAYQAATTTVRRQHATARAQIVREEVEAEAEIRERAAEQAQRAREDRLARAIQAEQAAAVHRQRLLDAAATAQAAAEQQLQSGRATLATPWERATAAIERWETAARRAVALRRETAEALAQGRPDVALHAAAAAAEAETDYTRITVISAEQRADAWETEAQRALAASRRWQDGAQRGLQRLNTELRDFAALSERAVVGAFSAMEDALVRLVSTGKLGFADLAQSIIADIARIAIRQQVTLPLLDFFGAAFLGGGGLALPVPAGVNPGINHAGGIIGALDGTRRSGIPDAAWLAAPRFHAGGLAGLRPNEVPTILERGEEVLTARDPRHRANLALPEVTVNVINQGAPQRVQSQRTRVDGAALIVDVVVADIAAGGRIPRVLAAQPAR